MKMTQLLATVALITASGLLHADEPPPPPVPPPYGAAPAPGPGPVGYEKVIRERSRVIFEEEAPDVAGPAFIIPHGFLDPRISAGCVIQARQVRPNLVLFKISVMWRNGRPGFQTPLVAGPEGRDLRIQYLQDHGYCLDTPLSPIMYL